MQFLTSMYRYSQLSSGLGRYDRRSQQVIIKRTDRKIPYNFIVVAYKELIIHAFSTISHGLSLPFWIAKTTTRSVSHRVSAHQPKESAQALQYANAIRPFNYTLTPRNALQWRRDEWAYNSTTYKCPCFRVLRFRRAAYYLFYFITDELEEESACILGLYPSIKPKGP